MAKTSLRVAIISDLHCHPEHKESHMNGTLLFSDKLRAPSKEHPVENLLEIIQQNQVKVDLVMSPGDFTHMSDKQGFFSGWSYVNELARALDATDVIATVGNHDIDSRHDHSKYSFDIPKKIKQNFPLKKSDIGLFWDKGFTFIEDERYQILVINSTHFHTHYEQSNPNSPIENPAVKGKVEAGQIEEIEEYLQKNNAEKKIKLCLCHHHPIKHGRSNLGEYDFVENGEDLLDILGKYKYDFFIHGHKHDPFLRYYNTLSGYQMPILSSGSFAATAQIMYASKFNYFHIVELTKEANAQAQGKVETWTFKNKIGWTNDKDEGFYPYSGFGYLGSLPKIVQKIKGILQKKSIHRWAEIQKQVPEVQFLTPDQMDTLEGLLGKEKIRINPNIGVGPVDIYFYETD